MAGATLSAGAPASCVGSTASITSITPANAHAATISRKPANALLDCGRADTQAPYVKAAALPKDGIEAKHPRFVVRYVPAKRYASRRRVNNGVAVIGKRRAQRRLAEG